MNRKILFCSRELIYKSPFGAVRELQKVKIAIKISQELSHTGVALVFRNDNSTIKQIYKLKKIITDNEYSTYEVEFFAEKKGLYFYRFEVYTKKCTYFCGRDENANLEIGDFLPEWQLTVFDKEFVTPISLSSGIMYQIFPDRFAKAELVNMAMAKNNRKIRNDWGGIPDYIYNTQNYTATDFFMGNIEGIIGKLPYIKSLGVSIIYLNPIFEAAANHRYNTSDYNNVDSFLGTNEDFEKLCKKAKKLQIKIILDGVFSHTGDDSIYFNKYSHYASQGAYNSDNSPYKSWYTFYENKDKYDCWWNFKTLPNVTETDEKYLEFITGDAGILNKWQKLGASGWRLDVADELPDLFLEKLRDSVKKTDENAVIIGEVWEDATTKSSYGERREFLLGNQLDTVMNYVWKDAIINLFKNNNVEVFINNILDVCENYPKPSIDVMMNLLSTHDTERIITVLSLEDNQYPEEEDFGEFLLTKEQYEKGENLLITASTILYFLPGIPCIYYGDEIGMQGMRDPYNRVCFNENNQNEKLLSHYKKLGEIRTKYSEFFENKGETMNFEIKKEHALLNITRVSGEKSLKIYLNFNHYDVTIYKSETLYTKGYENNHLETNGFIITD